jgi:glutathione S-transferase
MPCSGARRIVPGSADESVLEELDVEYEIVHHRRNPRTGLSPESLRAVHPLAKAPTVEIQGTVMIES